MTQPIEIHLKPDPILMQRMDALERKMDMILARLPTVDEYIDAAQVGQLLGYAERTVADKLSKRSGFPKRFGRRWNKAAVLKWAADNI